MGGALLAAGAGAGAWSARRRLTRAAGRSLTAVEVDPAALPPAGEGLDFLVTGDSGQSSEVRVAVVQAMARTARARAARFVVLTGDNVYPAGVSSAEDPAWTEHFEQAFRPLLDQGLPFYPCLGNHDHMGDAAAQVSYAARNPAWRLPAPYHAFTEEAAGGSAEFFVLDTTPLRQAGHLSTPGQAHWLDAAMGASRADWKIAVGHHPLRSGGPKGGSSKVRWHASPLFAEHDLDLYLSGHNHGCELIDGGRGWLQVVSGAGSAPDTVEAIGGTLFHATGGGYVLVTLGPGGSGEAWLRYDGVDGPRAAFRIERS